MSFCLAFSFRHDGRQGLLRQVFLQGAGDHHFGLASAMLALADLFEPQQRAHSPQLAAGLASEYPN